MAKASQIFQAIDKSTLPKERKDVVFKALNDKLKEQKKAAKPVKPKSNLAWDQRAAGAIGNFSSNIFIKPFQKYGEFLATDKQPPVPTSSSLPLRPAPKQSKVKKGVYLGKKILNSAVDNPATKIFQDLGGQFREREESIREKVSGKDARKAGIGARALGLVGSNILTAADMAQGTRRGAANLLADGAGNTVKFARKTGSELLGNDEGSLRARVDDKRFDASVERIIGKTPEDNPAMRIGEFVGKEGLIQGLIFAATGGVGNVPVGAARAAKAVGTAKKVGTAGAVGTSVNLAETEDLKYALIAGTLEAIFAPTAKVAARTIPKKGGKVAEGVVEGMTPAQRIANATKKIEEEIVERQRELLRDIQFKTKAKTDNVIGKTPLKSADELAVPLRGESAGKVKKQQVRVAREFVEKQGLETPIQAKALSQKISKVLKSAEGGGSNLSKSEITIFREAMRQIDKLAKELFAVEQGAREGLAVAQQLTREDLEKKVLRYAELADNYEKKGLLPDEINEFVSLEEDIIQIGKRFEAEPQMFDTEGALGRSAEGQFDQGVNPARPDFDPEIALGRSEGDGSSLSRTEFDQGFSIDSAGSVIDGDGVIQRSTNPDSVKPLRKKDWDITDMDKPGVDKDEVLESVYQQEKALIDPSPRVLQTVDDSTPVEQTVHKLNRIRANANFYITTASDAIDALPRDLSNALKERLSQYTSTMYGIQTEAYKTINKMRKINPRVAREAINKRKSGRTDFTPKELEYLQLNDEVAQKMGRAITSRGAERLDGELIELRKDFTPDSYVNYISQSARRKKAYIEEVMKLNPGKFKNAEEAKAFIEEDLIKSSVEGSVHFSGSLAFRRDSLPINLPLNTKVSPIEEWEVYIQSMSAHLAKYDALGMRAINNKYVLTDVEDLLKQSLPVEKDANMALDYIKSYIDEGDSIMKKAATRSRAGQGGAVEGAAEFSEGVSSVLSPAASLVVGVVKPLIYDVGNIMRTVAVNRQHSFNVALGLFRAGDRKILKEMRDMGILSHKNTILLDEEGIGQKFMEYLFKLPSISQQGTAHAQALSSMSKLRSLNKKATKKGLSKGEIRLMKEEYGFGDFQIEMMKQGVLPKENFVAALIHNVDLTVNARRAGSIPAKEKLGGATAQSIYKFAGYALLPTRQMIRAGARGDMATVTAMSAGYLGMGKFVNEFGEDSESGRLAKFIHMLIDPNKGELASEQTTVEQFIDGAMIVSGVDMFFRHIFESNPRVTQGGEKILISEKLVTPTAYTVAISQANTLAGELQKLAKGEKPDYKKMTNTVGFLREATTFINSAETPSITERRSNSDVAELVMDKKLPASEWEKIPDKKRAPIMKDMAIIAYSTYGKDHPITKEMWENYSTQRTQENQALGKKPYKEPISNIERAVMVRTAKDQGKDYHEMLYDRYAQPDGVEYIKTLKKRGSLTDNDILKLREIKASREES